MRLNVLSLSAREDKKHKTSGREPLSRGGSLMKIN
jgi:hypothetical protein